MRNTPPDPTAEVEEIDEGAAEVSPEASGDILLSEEDVSTSRTPIPLWKKLTAAGSWVVAAFFLFLVLANGGDQTPRNAVAGASLVAPTNEAEVPADTLGIRFEQLRDLWNSVEHPPLVTSPLRRTPEGGELDSFYYRFDPQAELIGAYRDSDDYLVALLVRANVEHVAVSTIYLHLCHLVNPFSPECLDNYFSLGLGGIELAELTKTGSETTWMYEDNEWRVNVTGNQLTIRVVAPGAN